MEQHGEFFDEMRLPALTAKAPPAVPVEALVAIDEVHLMAGDVPRGAFREFYGEVLALMFVGADEERMCFSHQRRRVVLERGRGEPGRLGLLLKNFSEAMVRLRDKGISYELLHTDAGLTRMAILRDPAGNWVHLVETRAF